MTEGQGRPIYKQGHMAVSYSKTSQLLRIATAFAVVGVPVRLWPRSSSCPILQTLIARSIGGFVNPRRCSLSIITRPVQPLLSVVRGTFARHHFCPRWPSLATVG